MTRRIAILIFGTLLLATNSVPGSSRRYVVTPRLSWDEFVPYLKSQIVPGFQKGRFEVLVCESAADKTMVTPFDDKSGDFAKVLLFEALMTEKKFGDRISRLTDTFRERLGGSGPDDLRRIRENYWGEFFGDTSLTKTLRSRFDAAIRDGRLRCRMCEQDPSFKPLGMEDRHGVQSD